ncbi:hypothetical protein [Streptomyces sp. NPDC005322]|uniref:hypothetical protein n=1 Tax=Streptomyces sp. NPDC005322 TaxID=3157032 RepID=UPI0033B1FC3B
MTDTDNTETRAPQQLLVDLAELHMRTHASPLPKHQATTGSMAAGFARALHALMEVDPAEAAAIAEWFDGPFGEGPDSMEHTGWTGRHIAKSPEVLEQWSLDARYEAARALEATEAWEKTEKARQELADPGSESSATEATVNCHDVQMDDGENLTALGVGNYLELDRPTVGMAPGTWRLTAYRGEFDERATLRLMTAGEVAALRRSEAFSRMYS